jgi:hypothetical protein
MLIFDPLVGKVFPSYHNGAKFLALQETKNWGAAAKTLFADTAKKDTTSNVTPNINFVTRIIILFIITDTNRQKNMIIIQLF